MFGKNSFDDVLKAVRNKQELVVPISEFAIDNLEGNGKVTRRSNFMDMMSVAKRRFRKPNPIAPNQADIVQWILYDRISFAQGAVIPSQNKLFVIPQGSGGKTKVDTNLEFVSQLTPPQWMNVTSIGFFFNNNVTGVDLDAFFNSEYMEFWVTQKVYAEGPLQCFPSGAGRFGSAALGTMGAAATSFTNSQGNGWPVTSNMFDVRLPGGLNLGVDQNGNSIIADGMIGITILQGQNFYVKLNADAGGATLIANTAVPIPGTGLTCACYLHGILSRQVQ
jgi:hypothetical protein